MRLLYLDWPHLPLRLALGREPGPDELVVLGGRPWDPGDVLDHSPAAGRLGVQRGQPLGRAHDLAPDATFLEARPGDYAAAFEAALGALSDLAPAVEGETSAAERSFGQAFLGIEGLARLWGDEASLLARAVRIVAPILPGPARTGIGNTRFGAQVAAVTGSGATPPGGAAEEAAFLAPLPLGLLPVDAATRDRLRVLGLTRMGELAALDRSAVIARFGATGGELHDLVRGMDGRPLRPRRPVERLRAEVELEPSVDALEPLRFVLHHLCGTLCEQLSARGAGASHAVLTLTLEAGPGSSAEASGYDQALPEPAAAPDLLERLLMARLEAKPPGRAVERLSLELAGTAPAAGQQLTLFERQLGQAARLDWQLASLAIRFGSDRILRARLADAEALLSEQRFTWRPAVEG
jgi:protein ImuB